MQLRRLIITFLFIFLFCIALSIATTMFLFWYAGGDPFIRGLGQSIALGRGIGIGTAVGASACMFFNYFLL